MKNVLTAAGIRIFIKSPFNRLTLREAVIFVLIALVIVPFGTAFWGAAFTVSYNFGTDYWVEWRNLGVSNGVTAIVLVPAILLGVHLFRAKRINAAPRRILEAGLLAAGIVAVGYVVFDRLPAGPDTSPALLYAPIPLLIWAALRFGLGGISASMLVITTLAIWGTMQGRGPFLAQTPAENALALQLFLLVAATPLMLLAVAIGDERHSKEALRLSEQRMSLAAESAQLALWDWDVANDKVWMTDEGRRFFGFEPGEPIHFSNLATWADASIPTIAPRVRRRSSTRGRLSVLLMRSIASSCPMVRCDGSPRAAAQAPPQMTRLREYSASRWTSRAKSRRVRRRSCNGRSWRTFPAWPA